MRKRESINEGVVGSNGPGEDHKNGAHKSYIDSNSIIKENGQGGNSSSTPHENNKEIVIYSSESPEEMAHMN